STAGAAEAAAGGTHPCNSFVFPVLVHSFWGSFAWGQNGRYPRHNPEAILWDVLRLAVREMCITSRGAPARGSPAKSPDHGGGGSGGDGNAMDVCTGEGKEGSPGAGAAAVRGRGVSQSTADIETLRSGLRELMPLLLSPVVQVAQATASQLLTLLLGGWRGATPRGPGSWKTGEERMRKGGKEPRKARLGSRSQHLQGTKAAMVPPGSPEPRGGAAGDGSASPLWARARTRAGVEAGAEARDGVDPGAGSRSRAASTVAATSGSLVLRSRSGIDAEGSTREEEGAEEGALSEDSDREEVKRDTNEDFPSTVVFDFSRKGTSRRGRGNVTGSTKREDGGRGMTAATTATAATAAAAAEECGGEDGGGVSDEHNGDMDEDAMEAAELNAAIRASLADIGAAASGGSPSREGDGMPGLPRPMASEDTQGKRRSAAPLSVGAPGQQSATSAPPPAPSPAPAPAPAPSPSTAVVAGAEGAATTAPGVSSTPGKVCYRCDGCDQFPLQQIRFHCLVCPDFDLCPQCYNLFHGPGSRNPKFRRGDSAVLGTHSLLHQMEAHEVAPAPQSEGESTRPGPGPAAGGRD
ncbi:unnamed protein product, partial [Discosporangium mesarthrocarpum]